MTIRSRPVLDRKHRPRWQDELRTQQLTVIAFAIAIAVALGIFGAAAWNGYWEAHLRPVATVAGSTFTRGDLTTRERIITAETVAEATELNDQLSGGPRDQIIQQQIESLSQRLNSLSTTATTSLVDGAVLAARADTFGVAVTDDEVAAAVAERMRLPERVAAQVIVVNSLPDDAAAGDEPTEEQIAAARSEAEDALERIEGGAVFATVANEVSDDFTASTGGALGWFADGDSAYDEYFDALAGAEVGDFVGPIETERGFAVLELLARREATTEGGLADFLEREGVDNATYREFVGEELLVEAFRTHFAEQVVASPAPQRRVSEIVIRAATEAVQQERARHVLIQPDPEAESQAEASDEAWDAALQEAREVADLVAAEDADWFAIAEEHSDDTGSGARGGDLGWYDPTASPFVTEFAAALTDLEVGEISDPVRTEFGYHVIQKTGERESPQGQATELVEELRADPDSFAETATSVSENHETAAEGGELGWVAAYQLDAMLEDAIFALTEVGQISDPIEAESGDITIYQLLETSDSREIEDERLEEIQDAGFDRWLSDEVRAGVETWVDPQFASTTATG